MCKNKYEQIIISWELSKNDVRKNQQTKRNKKIEKHAHKQHTEVSQLILFFILFFFCLKSMWIFRLSVTSVLMDFSLLLFFTHLIILCCSFWLWVRYMHMFNSFYHKRYCMYKKLKINRSTCYFASFNAHKCKHGSMIFFIGLRKHVFMSLNRQPAEYNKQNTKLERLRFGKLNTTIDLFCFQMHVSRNWWTRAQNNHLYASPIRNN